jgi:hypothetical protein
MNLMEESGKFSSMPKDHTSKPDAWSIVEWSKGTKVLAIKKGGTKSDKEAFSERNWYKASHALGCKSNKHAKLT